MIPAMQALCRSNWQSDSSFWKCQLVLGVAGSEMGQNWTLDMLRNRHRFPSMRPHLSALIELVMYYLDGWGFSYFQSGGSPTELKYQVIGGIHAIQYMRGSCQLMEMCSAQENL